VPLAPKADPRDPKNPDQVVFNDALTLAVGEDPIDLTVADLDGDGSIDVATTGGLPASIVHGDLDGDSKPGEPADVDLAFTAHATADPTSPRVVKILRNDRENGVLILSPAEDVEVQGSPRIVLAESMDLVPGLDLVTVQVGGSESIGGDAPIATASVRSGNARSVCGVADLNCDGLVDGADLGILLLSWGVGGDPAADLTGDGLVDGADLGLLLVLWGSSS
jgi:hypothetical protein